MTASDPARHAILAAALLWPVLASGAHAQTTLPGVTVTTPSPVAKPAPSVSPAPAAAKTSSAPAPAPANPPPAADSAPPPGTLIVVDDSFVPVTVILDGALAANPTATLADLLSSKPGLAASTFAPGASRPIIRGLGEDRVRVLQNGIGAIDAVALMTDTDNSGQNASAWYGDIYFTAR